MTSSIRGFSLLNTFEVKRQTQSTINYQQAFIFTLFDATTIQCDDIEKLANKYLHPYEKLIINKRIKVLAKKEYIASRLVLKRIISLLYHCKFEDIDLFFDEKESLLIPRLHQKTLPFTLSVSHSKGMVLIGITQKSNLIGVDIEFINVQRDVNKLAKAFFHPNEHKNVIEKGHQYFYQLWTLKEATAKILQQPIVHLLNKDIMQSVTQYSVATSQYLDYSLAILSSNKISPYPINLVNLEDFY